MYDIKMETRKKSDERRRGRKDDPQEDRVGRMLRRKMETGG
jgi:hypothetical protein